MWSDLILGVQYNYFAIATQSPHGFPISFPVVLSIDMVPFEPNIPLATTCPPFELYIGNQNCLVSCKSGDIFTISLLFDGIGPLIKICKITIFPYFIQKEYLDCINTSERGTRVYSISLYRPEKLIKSRKMRPFSVFF